MSSLKTTNKNNNRTVYFKMRVTQEEYEMIRKNAKSFGGISSYIRAANAEYSSQRHKETVDFMYDLYRFHFEYSDDISWYGYGLNQSVMRVNELAKAGKLTTRDIVNGPLEGIKSLGIYLTTVKTELCAVIERARQNGIQIKCNQ